MLGERVEVWDLIINNATIEQFLILPDFFELDIPRDIYACPFVSFCLIPNATSLEVVNLMHILNMPED